MARTPQATNPRIPAAPAKAPPRRMNTRDRKEQLRAIVAMAGTLTASLEPQAMLEHALRWAVAISGHQQGSIMLSDATGRNLTVRAVYGQDPSLLGRRVRTSDNSVAGWVLKHRQHLYLEDRGDRFPGGERSYTKNVPSSVVLPLLSGRGRPLGVLSLNATTPRPPLTNEDIEVLQAMANLVAVALNDAALYRALQEKDRQLHAAASHILKAQDEERKRIAYDIHDGLAQMIASTHQRLQAYRAHPDPLAPEAVHELDSVERQLRQSMEEARRVIGALRPSILDDFGLETALRQHLADRQAETGWDIDADIDLSDVQLSPDLQNAVYRIVQEATTNAMKHAGSDRLAVKIGRVGRWLEVVVRDWGAGFGPEASQPGANGQRIGLSGIADRAALLGGTLRIESKPNQGTALRVRLPVDDLQLRRSA